MNKLLLILIALFILPSLSAMGQENFVTDHNGTVLKIIEHQTTPMMLIKNDGTIEINGVPIERLSDTEIKESIKKIAESMTLGTTEWFNYYERQTETLLNELASCHKELEQLKNNK